MSVLNSLLRVRRDRALANAFRTLLLGEDGKPTAAATAVLAHLRTFCHADVPTTMYDEQGRVDPYASAVAAGKQAVWFQFNLYLYADPAEMVEWDRKFVREIRESVARSELMV